MKVKIILVTTILMSLFTMANSKTVYAGYGEVLSTIQSGINAINGGDTLIVREGTYTGSANIIRNVPNGSPGHLTTIIAENDNVILDGEYTYNMILLADRQYIQIEGFTIVKVETGCEIGSYTKILRCGFGMSGYDLVVLRHEDDYNLFEDCHFWGYFVQAIIFYGANHNIVRRCVVRWDGRNFDGSYTGVYGMRCYSAYTNGVVPEASAGNNLFQNVIFLDFNTPVNTLDPAAAALRVRNGPMHTDSIMAYGCIVLNLDSHPNWRGFVMANHANSNKDNDLYNSVAWEVGAYAIDLESESTSNITVQNCLFGYSNGQRYGAATDTFKNNIYINNNRIVGTNSVFLYNNFYNTTSFGSNYVTYNPLTNGLRYLIRVEPNSNLSRDGENGGRIGPNIVFRYGRSGTIYGEPGYKEETNEPLWPFPYEDRIKKDFTMNLELPPNADPPSYDPQRGFCAPNMTLTKYIWEYLGNPMPDDIYSNALRKPKARLSK